MDETKKVQCLDCGQPIAEPNPSCGQHGELDVHSICEACWEKRLLEATPNEVLYCIDCNKRCGFLPGDDEDETDEFPFTICDDCGDRRALKAGYVWNDKDKRYVKK